LANVIEHATILCPSGPIGLEHLPTKFEARRLRGPAGAGSLKAIGSAPQTLREIEMQVIYQALERLGGNKPKAAEELGISLKTLYNKLNQSNAPLERSA
jgi:DNA-binding NtrC family response regulator